MEPLKEFPWIMANRKHSRFESLGGLKLKSTVKGDIPLEESSSLQNENVISHPLHPKKQQQAREPFLHAIAAWPDTLSLELHMTSIPNLVHKAQSQILISLFLLHTIAPVSGGGDGGCFIKTVLPE